MCAAVSFPTRYVVMFAFMLTTLQCVHAQTSAAVDDEPQSVEVKAVRDPAIMPYKTAYDMISKIRRASRDRVQILIRTTSTKSHLPLQDLDIYLDGATTHEKIEISPSGFVNVPLNEMAYADGAEFVTNKKKGSLQGEIFLVPKLPAEAMKYADIAETILAAKSAMSELIPWYWRMFLPSIKSVGICYADKDQAVLIRGGEETSRVADNSDTDILKRKVYCANFSAKEASIEKESLILPSAGWQAIFQ